MPGDGTCPHCGKSIDPGDFPWRCPACGQDHPHHNLMTNCDNCRFGARLIVCQHCHKPFEGFLLIGEFTGDPMEVVAASAIDPKVCSTYEIANLKVGFGDNAEMFDGWEPETQAAMINVVFPFPLEPKGIFWYQAHVTEGGQHWMHGWILDRLDWVGENPEPCAQISLFYPTDSTQDPERSPVAGYKLSDIMAWTK